MANSLLGRITFPLLDLFARQIDPKDSPYNYIPTQWIAIMFTSLFSISTLVHTHQSFYYRSWWLLPTACLCGVMEIIGWAARLWSSINPLDQTPFTIQITATILAPTPLVAANFIMLGRIIGRLGPGYSRLSPKLYSVIFCACDVIALIVQGAGGGIASAAVGYNQDPNPGGNVMLGGIIFQMVTITIYVILGSEFYLRYLKDWPVKTSVVMDEEGNLIKQRGMLDKRLKIMTLALLINTVFLYIRAIYRTIELTDGFTGEIISTEIWFNIFDGAMIVLALYTLNFAHPGIFLKDTRNTFSFNAVHMKTVDPVANRQSTWYEQANSQASKAPLIPS